MGASQSTSYMAAMKGSQLVILVTTLVCMMSIVSVVRGQNGATDFLTPHNEARSEVGVPSLAWSSDLEMYAQDHANTLAATCQLNHTPKPRRYGENLYGGPGGPVTAADAVASWVSEKSIYEANSACVYDRTCGHYTQAVWRNTNYVGCGKADCDGSGGIIVCEYDPPGNYKGQKPYRSETAQMPSNEYL